MTGIEQEIAQLSEAALMEVRQAASPEELEALRVKYLGRKGSLTKVLRGLKDLDPDLRRRWVPKPTGSKKASKPGWRKP